MLFRSPKIRKPHVTPDRCHSRLASNWSAASAVSESSKAPDSHGTARRKNSTGKDSLFVLWQGLESLQKLGCLAAYIFRLSIFRAKTQAGQPRRFRSAPNKTIPPANSTSDAGSGAVCSSIWNPDQEA